jgi:hypothetical protein
VTQPNGSRELYDGRWWILPDGAPEPLPGAEVHIPTKPEAKTDRAAIVSSIAQVMMGVVTITIIALRR